MIKKNSIHHILKEKDYNYLGKENNFDIYIKNISRKDIKIEVKHMHRMQQIIIKCNYTSFREFSTGFFKDSEDLRSIEKEYIDTLLNLIELERSKKNYSM